MSVNDNKATLRRVFDEIWHKGDLSVTRQIYAKEFVYYGAESAGAVFRGPEGYAELVRLYRTAFPDIHFTVEQMIGEGDDLVCRWTGSGTHRGELKGVRPTGKHVVNPGVSVCRFAGGKIVEERAFWDEQHMRQSLGVDPAG